MVTVTPRRLTVRLSQGPDWSALALSGQIDEHNKLSELAGKLKDAHRLYVDLGAIKRINSIGVRDWVVWLVATRKRFAEVVLVDCPPAIMHEVNLVKNFAAGARIATFRAPYYCEACGKESVSLLTSADLLAQGVKEPPADHCERVECRNDLDDDGTFYFAFLDDQGAMPPTTAPAGELGRVRDALAASEPTALSDESKSPHARSIASVTAGRTRPVSAVSATPPAHRESDTNTGGIDLVFMLALAAMLAVLGVLIYLIVTLE